MDGGEEKILQFARSIKGKTPADWDHLPDIGLYMDQVVTFLERQLAPYRESEGDHLITPSMINNYTKAGVVHRAEAKKYSQSHIALLILVCTLKQVLSIPDLTRLLSGSPGESEIASLYASFRMKLAGSMDETAGLVDAAAENITGPAREEALRRLALDFAIEAQARSFAARKILAILEPGRSEKEAPKGRAPRKSGKPSKGGQAS